MIKGDFSFRKYYRTCVQRGKLLQAKIFWTCLVDVLLLMWIVTGGSWISRFAFIHQVVLIMERHQVVVIMERTDEDGKRSEFLTVSVVDKLSLLTQSWNLTIVLSNGVQMLNSTVAIHIVQWKEAASVSCN